MFAYNLVSGQPEIPPRVGWGEQMGSLVGSLWHALGEGDVARLREFAGRVLVDGAGRRYKIPSVDTMLAWWYATTDDVHDDIYKLFESDTSRKRSAGGQRAA